MNKCFQFQPSNSQTICCFVHWGYTRLKIKSIQHVKTMTDLCWCSSAYITVVMEAHCHASILFLLIYLAEENHAETHNITETFYIHLISYINTRSVKKPLDMLLQKQTIIIAIKHFCYCNAIRKTCLHHKDRKIHNYLCQG